MPFHIPHYGGCGHLTLTKRKFLSKMQLNTTTAWRLPTYKRVTVSKFLIGSTTEFLVESVLPEVVIARAERVRIPFTYIA